MHTTSKHSAMQQHHSSNHAFRFSESQSETCNASAGTNKRNKIKSELSQRERQQAFLANFISFFCSVNKRVSDHHLPTLQNKKINDEVISRIVADKLAEELLFCACFLVGMVYGCALDMQETRKQQSA